MNILLGMRLIERLRVELTTSANCDKLRLVMGIPQVFLK